MEYSDTFFAFALTLALVFFAVFLALTGLRTFLRSLGSFRQPRRFPAIFAFFQYEIESLSKTAGNYLAVNFNGKAEEYANNALAANTDLSASEVFAAKVLFMSLFSSLALALVLMVTFDPRWLVGAALLGLFIGWILPSTLLEKMAVERQEAIAKRLPFAVDLLISAMEAGLDFGAAVRYMVSEGNRKEPVIEEFTLFLQQTELGKSRIEALKEMSRRVQTDEMTSFANAICYGMEMSASVVNSLRIQAEDIRAARFNRAERKAARAPSLMLIPMALFIMPSVFIIIFTPVFIRVMDSGFSSIMKGGL